MGWSIALASLGLLLGATTAFAQSSSPMVTEPVLGGADGNTSPGPADGFNPSAPSETSSYQPAPPSGGSRAHNAVPRHLLQSLNDLDRPLSPEEITAYGQTLRDQFPLNPKLIQDYRRRLNDSQKAAAAPPSGYQPRAVTESIRVSLDTRSKTPQLDTSPGTVSILSFFDSTGAPWPVASFVIGRDDAFEVYAMQAGSNQLAVAPLAAHAYSNLAVSLVDEDQPLVIDLRTNEARTHYRMDVSLNARGPKARLPAIQSRESKMPASDELMMAFVQGSAIPQTAQRLTTDDSDVSAWQYNGALYLRTNQTLMSPSWSASLAGPGGIKAYRLRPAPVALISRNGQISKVRISQ